MVAAEAGVWLAGRRVATLRRPKVGRITCTYEPDVLDEHPRNVPLLSCSLPLGSRPLEAWAFCTGLLPEGQHRQALAARANLPTLDVLGLLARYGRDVAGAVVVSADDPPVRDARVEPYSRDALSSAVRELSDHPLGVHDDSELSIAGIQDKMLLVALGRRRWGRPVHGYPSTHILKVDDRVHARLVREEHACLTLARAAGIAAAESELVTVGDAECIVVRRFDRAVAPGGDVRRLHQEDACQALGIDPDDNGGRAKYEANGGPSLRRIAALLDEWAGDPEHELMRLLDAVVFTVLIGNADAHGKNLAFLHPEPGRIELAPLYDTVPTVLWRNLRPDAAMSVGGRWRLPHITLDDVVSEAAAWALPRDRVRARAVEVAERIAAAAATVDVDARAPSETAKRAATFLRGA